MFAIYCNTLRNDPGKITQVRPPKYEHQGTRKKRRGTIKRFLSLLLIALIVVMSAPAFAELESVTGCTDERIANIVNAAYASGEYDYKVITYGQQMVDKIVNLNTTVPMGGKDADGNFRVGHYATYVAIHTIVDNEELAALYEDCFGAVKPLKCDMPGEDRGTYQVIGASDESRVGEASSEAVIAVMKSGEVATAELEEGYQVLHPILNYDMDIVGVIEYIFRKDEGRNPLQYTETAAYYGCMVSETVQSYAFLLDPYTQGFKPDDMLCQKIEQIMLARHPELSVLSFHITDPSDPEQINKLYAINRPNFQFKVATEVTTEAEKSGRVTMCLLSSVRRMEAHVPLYNAQGEFVGVLVTVYVFDQLDEGADLYGRSMALMYEAAQMMPENFEELFQP